MRPKFKIKNVPETKDLKGGGSCEGPAVPAAGLELGLDAPPLLDVVDLESL